jgi:hypothetical protein
VALLNPPGASAGPRTRFPARGTANTRLHRRPSRRSAAAALEHLFQYSRLIVHGIARAENEGKLASTGVRRHFIDYPPFTGQLLEVATAEFLPFRRIMCKPAAQIRARARVFDPRNDLQPIFGNPARPHTVHQHPRTIGPTRRIVGASQRDSQGNRTAGQSSEVRWRSNCAAAIASARVCTTVTLTAAPSESMTDFSG